MIERLYWLYRQMYYHPNTPLFFCMMVVLTALAAIEQHVGAYMALGAAVVVYGPAYIIGLPSVRNVQKLDCRTDGDTRGEDV
jgi:hypothetical protein